MQLGVALASAVAFLSASVYSDTNTCVGGPCGPAHQQCGPVFGQNTPQFHVRDLSCGENDPNAPFYYNGMYHLFYQDHLAITGGHGPVFGHAASKDFVKWQHLPVGIWNDQKYDSEAIYSGSATIVDGKPVITYPGLCNKQNWTDCQTGTLMALALPADPSDPLLINWTKPSYNPIVNNTQRDPTTSWQEPSGEWRFTSYDASVFGSMDYKKWYRINGSTGFSVGECPSFFPLPSSSSPSTSVEGTLAPTHVFKSSFGGKDWMQAGHYVPGVPGQAGNYTPLQPFRIVDAGDLYASKDFYDSAKDRRILWGWARVPPASTQTLPRVVGWDAELSMVTFEPVEEQEQLRGQQLVDIQSPFKLAAGDHAWLGTWGDLGNQSELLVTFSRPSGAATFGVDVAAGTSSSTGGNVSTRVTVVLNGSNTAQVATSSMNSNPHKLTGYMIHTDLPGADFNVTNVEYHDAHTCQAVCLSNPECVAWTYVVRPPLVGSCCQKHDGFGYNPSNDACTSGVRTPGPAPTPSEDSDTLPLKQSEDTITIRVFLDNTFIEAFFNSRVAMTRTLVQQSPLWGMSVFVQDSAEPVEIRSVQAWTVDSIWEN